MSVSASISRQLPYLRRFSRAVSGTQQAGDAYVAALLEAFIADPGSLGDAKDLRVSLYRMFCRLWESVALNLTGTPAAFEDFVKTPQWAALAQQRISTIPPRARRPSY